MSPPRVRFTVRRLMVVVAVAAFALGASETVRRYRSMVALSRSYSRSAELCRATVDRVLGDASCWDRISEAKRRIPDPFPSYSPDDAAEYARISREKARRYRAMAARYERAARHPWLPIEPDLLEPE